MDCTSCLTDAFDELCSCGVHGTLSSGVEAFKMSFNQDAEQTFDLAMTVLKDRGLVVGGQLLGIVQSGRRPIWRTSSTHHIQVGLFVYACVDWVASC